MKYYIISGETSGDQHAADLIYALKKADERAEFRGVGGDDSKEAGLSLCLHQKQLAIMGFKEVLLKLGTIFKALKQVKLDILSFQPDKIILVDYPGFNLRIAKFAFSHQISVHYYIAPKVWAWKENRIKKLKKYIERVYCILPFEENYFNSKGVNAVYVGNPSKIKIDQYKKTHQADSESKVIALLPGSRKQEILASLPIMLKLKSQFPSHTFKVSQAPGFDSNFYRQFDADIVLESNMYDLLYGSKLAIVTSGTATLETALLEIPQIVCYRTSAITYFIAKSFVKLKYISLVNLILDQEVIRELIQSEFNAENISSEAKLLFENESRIEQMKKDYNRLQNSIGNKNPSEAIALFLNQ